ncbi:MAG: hypothetical protein M3535_00670 [Actinomycetota bacterium]|nr:hypothetical protein [Actinomycetota bacterium]
MQHSVVPVANSNLAKILLAGMIGLIAVGLLLLGITLGRRKGPKSPTPSRTKLDKTTAKVG